MDNNGYWGFYINARTDTYFQRENPFQETIKRAKAYVESGASGIFIPGLTNYDEIKEITLNIGAPLNVLSLPGLTNGKELEELGVKRLSFGNALSDKVIALLERDTARIVELNDTSHLFGG